VAISFNKVPFPQRILVEVYGIALAAILFALHFFLRATCRIRIIGESHLKENPHAIFALWHEHTGSFFVALPALQKYSSAHAWMSHPAWVMRPIHYLMRLYKIKTIFGASGSNGKLAAAELSQLLVNGLSTVINPDGPAGPIHQIKPGVLKLAQELRLPILPLKIKLGQSWLWPSWDSKRMPFPFTKIEIVASAPIKYDDSKSWEQMANQISEKLS
jgi:hypothetical protein